MKAEEPHTDNQTKVLEILWYRAQEKQRDVYEGIANTFVQLFLLRATGINRECVNATLLILRMRGLGLAAQGAQKLFDWFGGGGISGTGALSFTARTHPEQATVARFASRDTATNSSEPNAGGWSRRR